MLHALISLTPFARTKARQFYVIMPLLPVTLMDTFKLSCFGDLMAQDSPIAALMADLGEALNVNPNLLFLGGGNPALVPQAQEMFARHLQALSHDRGMLKAMLGIYQSPQGNEQTLAALAEYFNEQCGWPIGRENIALISGSQTAFFLLLNLFGGEQAQGPPRKIHLPLVPEYLGYGSQGISEGLFHAHKPKIRLTQPARFKYEIDFESLDVDAYTGALCVSRPTNPSGNLLTDDEIARLSALARQRDIPLIVDFAYGQPFPNLVYQPSTPLWNSQMIAVMSLSKLGLPGVRTAMIVADEKVIELVTRANTIVSLANGNLGPFLLNEMLSSGDFQHLTSSVLPSFYRSRRDFLAGLLDKELAGVPYRLHEPEGAFFVWLWVEGLPVSSAQLYQRLKQRGVLVMAGEPFFFGLEATWPHAQECIRLTYCQDEAVLRQAVAIIADELRMFYRS